MSANTNTPEMTLEQAISIFGEAAAKEMFKTIDQESAGGKSMPLALIKRCSDDIVDGDKIGDFIIGRKFDRDEKKNLIVVDDGINLGASFKMVMVSIAYRYERYDDAKERTFTSNVFTDVSKASSAIDAASGKPLPADKDDRKAAGWKMTKLISGVVEAEGKWVPFTFIAKGVIYYGIGELTDKLPRKGLLNHVIDIHFKIDKKGSTKFSAVDLEPSSATPLDFKVLQDNADAIGSVTTDMAAYYEAHKGTSAAPAAEAEAPASAGTDEGW